MIEVIPVQDKGDQEKICGLCGIEYKPDEMAYMAREKDDGKLLGAVQFKIRGKYGYLTSLRGASGISDDDALFILGRSAMNFLELCGIKEAYFIDSNPGLASALGFALTGDGKRLADLEKIFKSPCQCKNPSND